MKINQKYSSYRRQFISTIFLIFLMGFIPLKTWAASTSCFELIKDNNIAVAACYPNMPEWFDNETRQKWQKIYLNWISGIDKDFKGNILTGIEEFGFNDAGTQLTFMVGEHYFVNDYQNRLFANRLKFDLNEAGLSVSDVQVEYKGELKKLIQITLHFIQTINVENITGPVIAGSKYTIKWHSKRFTSNVDILYSANGETFSSIALNQTNDGSYTWDLSAFYDMKNVFVRIRKTDNHHIYDDSDEAFIIQNGFCWKSLKGLASSPQWFDASIADDLSDKICNESDLFINAAKIISSSETNCKISLELKAKNYIDKNTFINFFNSLKSLPLYSDHALFQEPSALNKNDVINIEIIFYRNPSCNGLSNIYAPPLWWSTLSEEPNFASKICETIDQIYVRSPVQDGEGRFINSLKQRTCQIYGILKKDFSSSDIAEIENYIGSEYKVFAHSGRILNNVVGNTVVRAGSKIEIMIVRKDGYKNIDILTEYFDYHKELLFPGVKSSLETAFDNSSKFLITDINRTTLSENKEYNGYTLYIKIYIENDLSKDEFVKNFSNLYNIKNTNGTVVVSVLKGTSYFKKGNVLNIKIDFQYSINHCEAFKIHTFKDLKTPWFSCIQDEIQQYMCNIPEFTKGDVRISSDGNNLIIHAYTTINQVENYVGYEAWDSFIGSEIEKEIEWVSRVEYKSESDMLLTLFFAYGYGGIVPPELIEGLYSAVNSVKVTYALTIDHTKIPCKKTNDFYTTLKDEPITEAGVSNTTYISNCENPTLMIEARYNGGDTPSMEGNIPVWFKNQLASIKKQANDENIEGLDVYVDYEIVNNEYAIFAVRAANTGTDDLIRSAYAGSFLYAKDIAGQYVDKFIELKQYDNNVTEAIKSIRNKIGRTRKRRVSNAKNKVDQANNYLSEFVNNIKADLNYNKFSRANRGDFERKVNTLVDELNSLNEQIKNDIGNMSRWWTYSKYYPSIESKLNERDRLVKNLISALQTFIYGEVTGGESSVKFNSCLHQDVDYSEVASEINLKSSSNIISSVLKNDIIEEVNEYDEAIEEGIMLNFELYPNPASNQIFLYVNTDDLNYQIVNLNGKVLLTGIVVNKEPIDISNLSPGFYIVNVFNASNSKSKKMIIK